MDDEVARLKRDREAAEAHWIALLKAAEAAIASLDDNADVWEQRALAAEAEVERLRNWIDDANLLCDCGAFDTDQLVTRGECPDCRKAVLAPEVK
jgi:hypothetical protein